MKKNFVKSLILPMALLALVACLVWACSGLSAKTGGVPNPDRQQLFIGDSIAIASTQYGKVRGYILRDVYTFLGVPYGASTAGASRFKAPLPPERWDGVRPTIYYGSVSPQNMENRYSSQFGSFRDHWNYTDAGEDCLCLNVWTPGLDNKERPVLVWFHGGGFTSGNGIEQDGYNGENLSRYGDIVFVSVNHRLGPVGFSDFSAVDPEFADSGNAGTLDMVLALQWVHDNISNFGGDPSNVTIMGQSGGGAKVCTLLAMSETKDLISKAVGLSGNSVGAIQSRVSAEIGKRIWELGGRDMKKLQEMPWEEYLALANKVGMEYVATHEGVSRRGCFGPVADGFHVPMGRFYSSSTAPSSKVPLLLCSTTSEFSPSTNDAALEEIDREGAIEYISKMLGLKNAEEAFDAFAAIFPDKKPIDAIGLMMGYRTAVIETANAKCVQDAPVYVAMFGWNSPLFDGRMRAPHCSDICFWFLNTDVMLTHTGGGAAPRAMSVKMADALLRFMRTGDPNGSGLPEWPVYDPQKQTTMFLGEVCKAYENLDTDALATLGRQ